MRRAIRKDRKLNGKCYFCNKPKRCEEWCWGPSVLFYIWIAIKSRKLWVMKFAWTSFKYNLEWAGTEPWHRYH